MALEPGVPAIEKEYQEGRAAYEMGKYNEAVKKFARVFQADPQHFNALVNWGAALSRDGKPSEAIAKFRQALALDPNNPNRAEAFYNWGTALERLGKHQEAVEKFEQAIALKETLSKRPALQRYLQRHQPQRQETQIGSPPTQGPAPR
jgi:tetratricopeptide (TPR) repeat protein